MWEGLVLLYRNFLFNEGWYIHYDLSMYMPEWYAAFCVVQTANIYVYFVYQNSRSQQAVVLVLVLVLVLLETRGQGIHS